MKHSHAMTLGRCARARAALLLAFFLFGPGCAAITMPIADGIPVRELPDEYRGKSREGLRPIPLTMLRQKPIIVHRVGPGDVLGIVIENVLGDRNQQPPVRLGNELGNANAQPAIGYPILVQDDGTISVPFVPPVNVEGLTLLEVQQKLVDVYTAPKKDILRKDA